jgi:hypothetical protein
MTPSTSSKPTEGAELAVFTPEEVKAMAASKRAGLRRIRLWFVGVSLAVFGVFLAPVLANNVVLGLGAAIGQGASDLVAAFEALQRAAQAQPLYFRGANMGLSLAAFYFLARAFVVFQTFDVLPPTEWGSASRSRINRACAPSFFLTAAACVSSLVLLAAGPEQSTVTAAVFEVSNWPPLLATLVSGFSSTIVFATLIPTVLAWATVAIVVFDHP